MSFKHFMTRRVVPVLVAGTLVPTVFFTTARDEWIDHAYSIKKTVSPNQPTRKERVVILGSGWGSLSFLQRLDPDKVDITVVSPRSFFFYTPLLAGCSTGTVASTSITESMRWHLHRFKGTSSRPLFLQAHASSIDVEKKTVTCGSSAVGVSTTLDYDQLVVAVGAESNTFNIKGVKEYATMMKEVEDSLKVRREVLEKLESANSLLASGASDEEVRRHLHWVVVGGGPTGVELTAELCDFVNSDVRDYFPALTDKIQISLIEGTGKVLGVFAPHISEYARNKLLEQGANVTTNCFVTGANEKTVSLLNAVDKSKSSIDYGLLVWAGGIGARPFTRAFATQIGGEQLPKKGPLRGLKVDNKFRVAGADNVWALGDCALSGSPPTAQAAYQQGKYLGRLFRETNCEREKVEEHDAFEFHNYGSLAYVGSSSAVADLKLHLWGSEHPAGRGQDSDSTVLEGKGAFAIWRSLYFSKMLSMKNRWQVLFDWCMSGTFGRDISAPYNEQVEVKKAGKSA
ncbi:hypothetical protein TrVE_jg13876 [Triparma verrucosa]|uniref:NADH:ubiquinone reductase (non-electrogenic) n=1 Tax=Triparma verrucosa TaxID=1606542 RepID=A0A9W7BSH9_9STRA|nr:hypothetical protein TrVE_jg13876 [Triparma verrucosa]